MPRECATLGFHGLPFCGQPAQLVGAYAGRACTELTCVFLASSAPICWRQRFGLIQLDSGLQCWRELSQMQPCWACMTTDTAVIFLAASSKTQQRPTETQSGAFQRTREAPRTAAVQAAAKRQAPRTTAKSARSCIVLSAAATLQQPRGSSTQQIWWELAVCLPALCDLVMLCSGHGIMGSKTRAAGVQRTGRCCSIRG